jgi:hypothetical protein
MEDAVVSLQLRHFISAMESLRRATLVMNLMERYLQGAGDDPRVFSYQVNVKIARERIRALSGTIPN